MPVSDYFTQRGITARLAVTGKPSGSIPPDIADEEYQQLFANFLWNGMYSREVVSQKVRELLSVACLAALYRSDQLRLHIRYALRLASPEEVKEAILQAGVFGGFPTVSNGLRVFAEVAREETPGPEAAT